MLRPTLALLAVSALSLAPAAQAPSYVPFEGGQVHPIRVSPDGSLLYAVNTADARLAVFSLADPSQPRLLREIPVGLEPVSVTPRTRDEVWVADWLSDAVSVVSIPAGRVVEVLQVGDEPSDVAFAGSPERAFVTAAASDEVWVFDVATRAHVATIPIFGRDPKALATSAAGDRVWVLVLRSGNRTTILSRDDAPPPPPPTNPGLPAAPDQSLIVRDDDPTWQASLDTALRDCDVVEIDAATLAVTRTISGVGTVLFDLAVDPAGDTLFVANLESRNLVRFEPVLAGHAVESRVTRVATGPTPGVTAWDLNPGFDYATLPNPAGLASALAEPTGIVFDGAQGRLWVAAQGTDRVAAVDPATGAVLARIELGAPGSQVDTHAKRGPRGLALHPFSPRLYVLNRLAHTIGVIDTAGSVPLAEVALGHDPTPADVRQGRRFLYDAKLSGNGTLSCAACHVDAEWDGLAWDLGDPGGVLEPAPAGQPFPFNLGLTPFHPMKGPMTTQTLRGLAGTGPFHWRGDRPTLDTFQRGFTGILGGQMLAAPDMDLLVAFLESLAYPPNPNQELDRSFSTEPPGANAAAGELAFAQPATVVFGVPISCQTCHTLPTGTNGFVVGTLLATVGIADEFKVAQLRGVYRKDNPADGQGHRKLGFGLVHDGDLQDVAAFLDFPAFDIWPDATKDDLAAFLLAFDTGTAPAVAHRARLGADTAGDAALLAELALLEARAAAGDVDLVAKGVLGGLPRGLLYVPASGHWVADDPALGPWTQAALVALAQAGAAELVLTGVPPGSGTRLGIDRDEDGVLDGVDGLRPYGVSTPGCAGDVQLLASGEPRVGDAGFRLIAANAQPGAPGLLGVSRAAATLPGVLGVTLLVDPFAPGFLVLAPVPEPSGFAVTALPIPPQPALAGATFHAQAVFLDPCGPAGLAATHALAMTIAP